jgi:hypothetical protein
VRVAAVAAAIIASQTGPSSHVAAAAQSCSPVCTAVPRRIFFRWEPAPILVCVEDLTEDLD